MAKSAIRGRGAVQALTAVAVASPLLVLVAIIGVRGGLLPVETGYDLLTLKVAWWLAFAGVVAGVLAVIVALKNFRALGVVASTALVVALVNMGGFVWQKGRLAAGPVENVSTDLAEIPGFGDVRPDDMGQGAAVGVEACPGALPVITQIAPESAAWAIQEAGFTLRRTGVSRADGTRSSTWFGFGYDVVMRIRPGRTDIRVAARDARPHGGEACRLVTAISASLRDSL